MPAVGRFQRTAAFIRPGETAGGCEFCPWQGAWVPQSEANTAAAEARAHLGVEHPEQVTHWMDLL